ncbi:hypothetical protein BJX62DRAFT_114724 [Aspergillus germanicus]
MILTNAHCEERAERIPDEAGTTEVLRRSRLPHSHGEMSKLLKEGATGRRGSYLPNSFTSVEKEGAGIEYGRYDSVAVLVAPSSFLSQTIDAPQEGATHCQKSHLPCQYSSARGRSDCRISYLPRGDGPSEGNIGLKSSSSLLAITKSDIGFAVNLISRLQT